MWDQTSKTGPIESRYAALVAFLFASFVSTGEIPRASAGTFGDYKDEKHESSGSSNSSSTNDSDSDDDDDEDSWGWFWGDDSEDHDDYDDEDEGGREPEKRYTARSCHYRRYRTCMSECGGSESRCHTDCRARTNRICGTPSSFGARQPGPNGIPAGTSDSDAPAPELDGGLGGGLGIVNGAAIATGEVFVGWGTLGLGGQLSLMWNPNEMLVETDVGPRLYHGTGPFRFGLQPSLMLSGGNGVETLAGVGVRPSLHAERADWFVDVRPLVGYIGGNLNVHSRAGVGYDIGENLYIELGHDFRFVHSLSGGGGTGLHGGFLAIGTGF